KADLAYKVGFSVGLSVGYPPVSSEVLSASPAASGASSSAGASSTGAFLDPTAAAFSSFFFASDAGAAFLVFSLADPTPDFLPSILASLASTQFGNNSSAFTSSIAPFLTPPSKCFLYTTSL